MDTMSEVNFGISYKNRLDIWKTAINRVLGDLTPELRITTIEEYTESEKSIKDRPRDYEKK